MGLLNKLFGRKDNTSQAELSAQNQNAPQDQQPLENSRTLLAFALLQSADLNEEALADHIRGEFGNAEVELSRDKLLSLIVHTGGAQFICTLMPFPMPDQEVENLFPYNSLSKEGEEKLASHQAYFVIAGNGFSISGKREACLSFNRLCGAVMGLEQAVGVYMGGAGLLLEKEVYLKHVNIIKSETGKDPDYFPAPLWTRVLLYMEGKKKMARTNGLNEFGFPDVCIYDTHQEPGILYQQLYMLAIEEITGRGIYENGDLIRVSENTEAVCKLSDGVLYIIGT